VSIASRDREKYGLPGWLDLLRLIGNRVAGKPYPGALDCDAWAAADQVVAHCEGNEELIQNELWRLVQKAENSAVSPNPGIKLLNKEFLNRAETLQAVAAFCVAMKEKRLSGNGYYFGPNPHVRAVISGNYDHYLEAAVTLMFQREILHGVGAYGSLAGNLNQIPVYHIHGYVPHPGQKVRLAPKGLVPQLVLTRRTYEAAWRTDNAYCPTLAAQIPLLRHYTTLFIGFSFSDSKINQLLRCLKMETQGTPYERERWHYAILRKGKDAPDVDKLADLGIKPIWVEHYGEIPQKLGKLYSAGLFRRHQNNIVTMPISDGKRILARKTAHTEKIDDVWRLLLACRLGVPGKKRFDAQLKPIQQAEA
jgi:hypothetical protein